MWKLSLNSSGKPMKTAQTNENQMVWNPQRYGNN
jgi:hypothetical protein